MSDTLFTVDWLNCHQANLAKKSRNFSFIWTRVYLSNFINSGLYKVKWIQLNWISANMLNFSAKLQSGMTTGVFVVGDNQSHLIIPYKNANSLCSFTSNLQCNIFQLEKQLYCNWFTLTNFPAIHRDADRCLTVHQQTCEPLSYFWCQFVS